MNGPEHYAEAERLLGAGLEAQKDLIDVARVAAASGRDLSVDTFTSATDVIARGIATAQVHATLALVAAQVETGYPDGQSRTVWLQVVQ